MVSSSTRPHRLMTTTQQVEDSVPSLLRGRGCLCFSIIAIIFSLCLLGGGVVGTIKLSKRLNFADFKATDRMRESESVQWDMWNPGTLDMYPIYVTLRTADGSSWLRSSARRDQLLEITAAVELELLVGSQEIRELVPRVRCLLCTDSYQNETLLTSSSSSSKNDTTVFVFTFLGGTRGVKKFVPTIENFIAKANATLFKATVTQISSVLQLQNALNDQLLPDLQHVDTVAVPVGLVVFAAAYRLHPLSLIVPVAVIGSSLAASLGCLFLISAPKDEDRGSSSSDHDIKKHGIVISAFALEIGAALCAALSLDMILFLVSRAQELHHESFEHDEQEDSSAVAAAAAAAGISQEQRPLLTEDEPPVPSPEAAAATAHVPGVDDSSQGDQGEETVVCCNEKRSRAIATYVVWTALKHTSHNIILTGVTIFAALATCAIAIDMDFVKSITWCGAFVAVFVMLNCITLSPALLYFLYPILFEGAFHRCFRAVWAHIRARCCCTQFCSRGKEDTKKQKGGAGGGGGVGYGTRNIDDEPLNTSSHSLPVRATAVSAVEQQQQEQEEQRQEEEKDNDDEEEVASPLTAFAIAQNTDDNHHHHHHDDGFYFAQVARFAARRPATAVIILLVIGLPFWILGGLTLNYDCSYLASAPQNAKGNAYWNYVNAVSAFENAIDTPYRLFFHSKKFSDLSTNFTSSQAGVIANCGNNQLYILPGLPIEQLLERIWPVLDFAVLESIRAFGGVDDTDVLSLGCKDCIDAINLFDGKLISYNESMALRNANIVLLLLENKTRQVDRVLRYRNLFKHLVGKQAGCVRTVGMALRPRCSKKKKKDKTGGCFNYGAQGSEFNPKLLQVANTVANNFNSLASSSGGKNWTVPIFNVYNNPPTPLSNLSVAPGDLIFTGLLGPNQDSWSVQNRVMQHMPLLVGIVSAILLAIVALMLRSVFASCILLLVVSYSVSMGIAVTQVLFHYGIWSRAPVPNFYWIILLLSVIIGQTVALDYCAFIFVRVGQMRLLRGVNNDGTAAVVAVARAGPVTGVAAVVLLIALGALALTQVSLLQQFGLACSVSVCVAAFIALPLLVPAAYSAVGVCGKRAAWWPRRMPDPELSEGEI